MKNRDHLNRYQKYYKPRREWYIQHGICPVCGQREASIGRQNCLLCKDDMDVRAKVYYQNRTPEQKARYKEQQRRHVKELEEKGLCRNCGQRPVAKGRKQCGICLQKDRIRARERNQEKHLPQELRGDGTYCYMCCRPLCNGEKLCTECYEKVTANLQKVQRDTSNHIWRKQEQARIAEVKLKHGW